MCMYNERKNCLSSLFLINWRKEKHFFNVQSSPVSDGINIKLKITFLSHTIARMEDGNKEQSKETFHSKMQRIKSIQRNGKTQVKGTHFDDIGV